MSRAMSRAVPLLALVIPIAAAAQEPISWGTADDDYGDLRLRYGSPVIDAGDNTAPGMAGISTDLDGNPRFYDVPGIADTGVGLPPVVDMGAYEAVNVGPLEVYLPVIVR